MAKKTAASTKTAAKETVATKTPTKGAPVRKATLATVATTLATVATTLAAVATTLATVAADDDDGKGGADIVRQ